MADADHGNVVEIKTEAEFREKVLSPNAGPVVVDCFAEWCGPCKAIAPKLAGFSTRYTDAKFYKIDVDDLANVAAELGVTAMPTFFFLKNGEIVDKTVGANPSALEAGIKKLVA
ncbi:TRXfamily protein [Aspergillus parasiticus SU-1]|uniref:Thioredoxin n=2 Tax=Aspergillus parasiticus TaxID=5067 RepID=A0A5N6DJG5_ASPPA|nr:thioredoxin-like protein [Aspergillus parasiticus]KJK60215.1 TRXfamily protein [Aspergillus parasiticus SU-1]